MIENRTKILLIIIGLLIFIFLPIKYPITVDGSGKLFPFQTWVLSNGVDGRLNTILTNNLTGISEQISTAQFERGDVVNFSINSSLISGRLIRKGDTIGYLLSNELEKNVEKLNGELKTAKLNLLVKTSREKESIVQEEKKKLEFAEKELEEQVKIFQRKTKLFERELISQEEFEADEARYNLAKINLDIAKNRVKIVNTGAKEEEINLAESIISDIENEIRVLQKKFEINNIVSPINGIMSRPYTSDSLIIINDTSKYVVLTLVKWYDVRLIERGHKVTISNYNARETVQGKVKSISNSIHTINKNQYQMVIVETDSKLTELKPGLLVDCNFECGHQPLSSIIKDKFKKIFML